MKRNVNFSQLSQKMALYEKNSVQCKIQISLRSNSFETTEMYLQPNGRECWYSFLFFCCQRKYTVRMWDYGKK